MATQYDQQLDSLKEDRDRYEKSLSSSPTAYAGGTSPSQSDLYKQTQLRSIEKQIDASRDKQIQERWFSDQEAEQSGGDTGGFGRALNVLSQPLYGIVGGIEHALGKGTESSLSGNINKNMGEGKRTFSDLLNRTGSPSIVSAPLGFALDVMFDPINWATAGTTALIPRLIAGTAKAGVKGATKAVTSSALEKASLAGRFTPYIKSSKKFKDMMEKSVQSSLDYNELIGKDILKNLPGNRGIGWGSNYRVTLRDLTKAASEQIPGGKAFLEAMDYDSANWMRLARIKDSLEEAMGTGDDAKNALRALAKGDDPAQHLKKAEEAFLSGAGKQRVAEELMAPDFSGGVPLFKEGEIAKGSSDIKKTLEALNSEMGDAADILNDTKGIFRSGDNLENALRIAMENTGDVVSAKDLQKILDTGLMDKTGVQWYDNFEKSVRNFKLGSKANGGKVRKVGEKALDTFGAFIATFKRAKVAGSPSAWTNAIVGNPVMAWMAGVNIMDPSFAREVNNSYKIIRNKDGMVDLVQQMNDFAEVQRYMSTNSKEFARTVGVSPSFLVEKKRIAAELMQHADDAGMKLKGMNEDEVAEAITKAYDDLIGDVAAASDDIPTPGQSARNAMQKGGITPYDLPTNIVATEMINSKMANKMFDTLAKRAQEPGNYGAKLLDLWFNKALSGYERIDQVYKLATFRHLSMNGISERELNTISRVMKIEPEDIIGKVKDHGVLKYQIRPEKSMELANDIYLNYQAMPSAIKMLRKMPLLGSPFASFMYGMSLKTMETMAYNPALFNKVNFAINDFGGEKSPLERKALDGKYYNYLNDPAMYRVPFFKDNPLYLNLGNVLPYYSLNMFNPTERPYEDTIPGSLVQLIDKSPILDDPVGQVLFDYMILPLILRDSQQPIGAFGQPIYPKGATGLEKTGLAARTMADTVMPGIFSLGGLAAPSSIAPGLPGYRTRQLSYAKEGKTSYGKTSKESAPSRTLRTLSAVMGVPVQSPVNLKYTEDEVKKGVTK